MIRVEVGILIRIFSLTVPEHMLSEGGAGHTVEMGCGGMSEQMRMEVLMNATTVRNAAKDILQGPGRYAFSPF